jgi:hypothetical protein
MKDQFPEGFSDIGELINIDFLNIGPTNLADDLLCSALIYLNTLYWVNKPLRIWEGLSFDRLIGVYLLHIEPRKLKIPEYHWIVSGPVWKCEDLKAKNPIVGGEYRGLPCAYVWTGYPDFKDANAASSPFQALGSYCSVIEKWMAAVRREGDGSRVFPVATPEAVTRKKYAEYIEPILCRARAEIPHLNLKHS